MVRFLLVALLLAKSSCAFSPTTNNGIGSIKSGGRMMPQVVVARASTATTRSGATSSSLAATAPAPVHKVAIIGAGIAGLSLAHALRSAHMDNSNTPTPIQIDIFDSRADIDETSGSGIQLTGGMAALRRINPELQKSISEAGLPLQKVVSKCKPWFEYGGSMNNPWQILELDIQEEIKKKSIADAAKAKEEGSVSGENEYGLVTEDGEVLAYTILRGTLQKILEESLMKEHDIAIQFDKKLCGISYSDSGEDEDGAVCSFADGSKTGPYDLVVGCDGIQSAVKQFVNTGKIETSQDKSKSDAIYSGLRITFAIQENAGDPNEGCQFNQFFGDGAYALTSSYGAGKDKPTAKGAFLVYPDANYIGPFPKSKPDVDEECIVKPTAAASTSSSSPANDSCEEEPAPLDENADWTQDTRVTRDHVTECMKVLESASIPGNDVSDIIRNSNRFFDLGVYLHNPFSLNGWVREIPSGGAREKTGKFAVTTGDASHAMPPFLGQGANQALQDSCSLASKIFEYNSQVQQPLNIDDPSSQPDLKVLLKEYESRRWLPTTSITAKAAFLGYLEVGPSIFSNFRDAFFFTMGKIGVAKKVFLDAATPKM